MRNSNKIWQMYWNVIVFTEKISRNVGKIKTINLKYAWEILKKT